MAVDPDVVDHVAALAKLRLTPQEREAMVEQLGRILDYVEKLQEVDVSGVPPTKHVVEISNVDRPDRARPSPPREAALANAPEVEQEHFAVPKVLPE